MYKQYDEYIDFEFSPDFWSDQGIDVACTFLEKFSNEDWENLSQSWVDKPAYWKVNCAQTLDHNLRSEGFAILSSMVNDTDSRVVVASVDSLRSWPESFFSQANVDVNRLEALTPDMDNIDRAIVTSFINKVRASCR